MCNLGQVVSSFYVWMGDWAKGYSSTLLWYFPKISLLKEILVRVPIYRTNYGKPTFGYSKVLKFRRLFIEVVEIVLKRLKHLDKV